jgi:MFS transporter, ACDE family, multidrug resistance protein
MGVANAILTDLSLALGDPDRRVTTGAFNLVRWGFAAPAPVIAGLLHPVGASAPYWVAVGVLAVGVVVFLLTAHRMAGQLGERVLWSRWNRAARAVEGTPEEAVSEL